MDLSGVDLVEKGHHDEGVEDHGEVLGGRVVEVGVATVVELKDLLSSEEQRENDGELVDGVAGDVFRHGTRHERFRASVRFAVEEFVSGKFSGERKRREGVHNQVHPQHLNGAQWRVL